MFSFFRSIVKSWAFMGVFAVILIGFIITGVEKPTSFLHGGSSSSDGATVAEVGDRKINEAEAARAAQDGLRRVEQPGVTMAMFVNQGGVDAVLGQLIDTTALESFADSMGIRISRRLIDSEIASMNEFRGPSGQFDEATYRAQLASAQIAEPDFRREVTRSLLLRMILTPVSGGARATPGFVRPYALLQLERRSGIVGAIPTIVFNDGKAPTDAELQQYYRANIIGYALPERRVVRYAVFDPAVQLGGKIAPTDAQIAAAYQADAAQYAARQTRGFTQIIAPDQAQANGFAERLKHGDAPEAVAASAGLKPMTIAATQKAEFASQSSAAIAEAAFAPTLPKGGVIVQRGPLGFAVIRVDSITEVPAKTLAEARPQILATLTQQQLSEASDKQIAAIEADADKRMPFAELARKYGLTLMTTPAVAATGTDPEAPKTALPPEIAPVIPQAFQVQVGDLVALTPIENGKRVVLWDVEKISPAAPRPFAVVRQLVANDFVLDRMTTRARKAAEAVAAKVNGGMSLPAALASLGVPLPPTQSISIVRQEAMRNPETTPPVISALFSMVVKRARVVPGPDGKGWFVVALDRVDGGNPGAALAIEGSIAQPFANLLAQEYAAQFAGAVRSAVGVKQNAAGVAQLKRTLLGNPAPAR